MPGTSDPWAPFFSGQAKDSLSKFLHAYKSLANGHGLSDAQKVEHVLNYIPSTLHDFWDSIDGFATGDWAAFCAALMCLYPNTLAVAWYTKEALQEFVDLSCQSQMRNEDDVLSYHRRFLHIYQQLHKVQLTHDLEQDSKFFKGLHPNDHEILANRIYSMKPKHPPHKPYEFDDVLTAARQYFANAQFHHPQSCRFCDQSASHPDPLPTSEQWLSLEACNPHQMP